MALTGDLGQIRFSLVAEIWGLARPVAQNLARQLPSFSLVAEIWGLARPKHFLIRESLSSVSVSLPRFGGWRETAPPPAPLPVPFQSRCRDLGVGELTMRETPFLTKLFQSRCRDLGVGERSIQNRPRLSGSPVSVSLPRFGGWRGCKR